MTIRIVISLLTGAVILACSGKNTSSGKGEFTVEWLGSDTGGISTAPNAVWCMSDTVLKIVATRGEDGVGVALFPVLTAGPGSYTVFDPVTDSLRLRPGVAIAARWVDDKSVAAYQGDSGSVLVTREANGLAGTFTARLHGVNTSDTVRMTGHFGGIVPGACSTDPVPAKGSVQ